MALRKAARQGLEAEDKEAIELAFKRRQKGGAEAIEGTLELAAALRRARAKFPPNAAFGLCLKKEGLDYISKDDRAGLLVIAEKPDAARRYMEETKSFSLQHIGRHLRQPTKKNTGGIRHRGDGYDLLQEYKRPAGRLSIMTLIDIALCKSSAFEVVRYVLDRRVAGPERAEIFALFERLVAEDKMKKQYRLALPEHGQMMLM